MKKLLIFLFLFLLVFIALLYFRYPILKFTNQPQPTNLPESNDQSNWLTYKDNGWNFEFKYPGNLQHAKYSDEINNYTRVSFIEDKIKLDIQDASVCQIYPDEKYYSVSTLPKKDGYNLIDRFSIDGTIYSIKLDGRDAFKQKNYAVIDNMNTFIEVFTCKTSEIDEFLSTFKFNN